MKKNKTRIIILSIIFILLCAFPIGFVYFSRGKYNNVKINDNENINLGDSGSCGKGTAYDVNPSCKTVTCSKYTHKASCDGTYGCCSWKASSSCGAGNYTDSAGNCVSCPAGTYSVSGSGSSCQTCGENEYSTGGAIECSQCRDITASDHSACYKSCGDIGHAGDCNNASSCSWDYQVSQCVNTATECPAGTYSYNGKCEQCPVGTYSTGGNNVNCLNCKGVISENQDKCTPCGEGQYFVFESKSCESCDGVAVDIDNGKQKCCTYSAIFPGKASPNTETTYGIAAVNDTSCPGYTYELVNFTKNSSNILDSISLSVREGKMETVSGLKECSTLQLTVYAGGQTVLTRTADVSSNWTANTISRKFKASDIVPESSSVADNRSVNYYGTCEAAVDGVKNCSVHVRSCGGGGGTPSYTYCCVNNGTLEASTKAVVMKDQEEIKCADSYTAVDVPPSECVIPEVEIGSCKSEGINPSAQTKSTSSCEDKVKMDLDEGQKCTNTTNSQTKSFYNITCTRTVNTSFDYGNDGDGNTIRTLNKGEGLGFGVNVETNVNCNYIFYEEVWKTAYNNVIGRIKRVDSNTIDYIEKNKKKDWSDNYLPKTKFSDEIKSELYDFWTVVEELRGAVDAYNKYRPSSDYKEKGTIKITTKENGQDKVISAGLVAEVKNEGAYKMSDAKIIKLDVPLVNDPQTYTLSTPTPRKVLLLPKRVCVNKRTGVVTVMGDSGVCTGNTIDGGNKIYIGEKTDITKNKAPYKISVEIEGLGSNDSKANDYKCDLNVTENTFTYRPIDVSNPFINSTWKKGENWVSEKYDFTKVIHENTWGERAYKLITITSDDIDALKKSNSYSIRQNDSPYIGMCEKSTDKITRTLCEKIK